LNRRLIVTTTAEAIALTPERAEALTGTLHEFIDAEILSLLKDTSTLPAARIAAHLQCLQDQHEYRKCAYLTNTPVAFELPGKPATVAVAFWIYRGGEAIPSLRPYLEVFARRKGTWAKVGETGANFISSTFKVDPLKSPRRGQHWFLLSGKVIGDTGSRLRLEIAAYDGRTVQTVWEKSGLRHTHIDRVSSDQMILKGDGTDAQGRYIEFTERYDVVPTGLKRVSRQVVHPSPGTRPDPGRRTE
jgi:hypothetical protein